MKGGKKGLSCKLKKLKKSEVVKKLGNNPWIISTIVLAIVLLCAFNLSNVSGESTIENVVGVDDIGSKLLDFYEEMGTTGLEVESVEEVSGVYLVNIKYQDNVVPIYATKDGKFVGSLSAVPTKEEIEAQKVEAAKQAAAQEAIDWSVFENELPSDVEDKISSFEKSSSEVYEDRISVFNDYDVIDNTLIVFYHSGCGWCSRYHPILVEAKEKYPELNIYALDLGEYREVASKYDATGTPANIINGKYFVSGYMPLEDLSGVLDKLM